MRARHARQARLQQRDVDTVLRIARNAAVPVLNALDRVPVKAWLERHGRVRDLKAVLEHHLMAYAPVLRDAMLTANLRARARAHADLEHHKQRRGKKSMGRYDDAIESLINRELMSEEEVEALRARYGEQAGKVLSTASDVLEEKLRSAVMDIVSEGLHVKGGVARLREAFAAAGVTPEAPWTLEAIARTEVSKAYGAGQYAADQTPAMREFKVAYRWVTAGDLRVRSSHAEMDGATAAIDHPVWRLWWPPAGFNCRCAIIPLYDDEEWEEDLPEPIPMPDEGFAGVTV